MQEGPLNIKGELHFGKTSDPIEFWQTQARPFGTEHSSVATYRGAKSIGERSGTVECREDFMLVYMLERCSAHEEWCNDHPVRVVEAPAGSVTLFDMRINGIPSCRKPLPR